ncbi:MAG: hypothetical protein ABI666_02610 [Ferruginibacter sp.]
MKTNKIIILILSGAFLLSCSSTKITSSWKAENTGTKIYHNIMVWGILTEKDSALREKMETHLVNDLAGKGYHAISSLNVLGSKVYRKLSEKEIVDQFKNSGVDAVITIVLLDKSKEQVYVPASIINNPAAFDHVDRYYSNIYDKVFSPGYYVTTTNYFWESNLFEVSADKLVYSVRTKSFDPSSTGIQAHENGVSILKDMLKKKVILDRVKEE